MVDNNNEDNHDEFLDAVEEDHNHDNGGNIVNGATTATTTSTSIPIPTNDLELLKFIEEQYNNEKLIYARDLLLNNIKDQTLLTKHHDDIIALANECENAIADLLTHTPHQHDATTTNSTTAVADQNEILIDDNNTYNGHNEWIKQGEEHGKYNTSIYFKYQKGSFFDKTIICCKLETIVPSNMLIPILSVLNETNLYVNWVPFFKRLNLGLLNSKELIKLSKVNQILYLYGPCPWPFSPRQLIIQSSAIDQTECKGDDYYIGIVLKSLTEEYVKSTSSILSTLPEDENKNAVYTDFNGTFLFRPYFDDNDQVSSTATDDNTNNPTAVDDQKGQPKIHVSFKMYVVVINSMFLFLPFSFFLFFTC